MKELSEHYKRIKKISIFRIVAHTILVTLTGSLIFFGAYNDNIYLGIFLIIFNSFMIYFGYRDYEKMKKKEQDLIFEILQN